MLRIGILGTRGIPNRYGGFEQLAQYLSAGLAEKGHEVFVYSPHNHTYKANSWKGVHIIHCFDPEFLVGMTGQFIYDLNCTIDARKRKFDVLLILGYTSSSIWGWLYPKRMVCINHMDGLEWQREKYGALTRKFLKYAEKLAIRFSQFHISDSPIIQSYLKKKYGINSTYIAYGADIICSNKISTPLQTGYSKEKYHLLIARMEKENNIEMILDGIRLSNTDIRFVVVGNIQSRYGRFLKRKYEVDNRIEFTGGIYDPAETAKLKCNCELYFHGHSVGGTNPSLLEAMASGATVCAHENVYNRTVLNKGGYYFSSAADVKKIIETPYSAEAIARMREINITNICNAFNWNDIITHYDQFIVACYNEKQHEEFIVYKGYYR